MKSFLDFGIDTKNNTAGLMKTTCPECSHKRKNKKDPCLSVNLSEGLWKCHNPGCGFQGCLKTHGEDDRLRDVYKIPKTVKQYSDKFLAYFKGRGISTTSLQKLFVYESRGWMPSNKPGQNDTIANFPVFRGTTPVNVKMRSLDKKAFSQKNRKIEGVKSSMIGLNRIVADDVVVIVEGEIDMLTYVEVEDLHGRPIQVITVPQGAPNPDGAGFQKYFEFLDVYTGGILRKVKHIYLSMDDDAPGKKLQEELGRRLGMEKCRLVRYPKGCKDINDVLMQHGKEAVLECLKTTKPFPIKGLIRVGQAVEQIEMIRNNGFKRGLLTGIEKIDKKISLKEKLLYVVTGVPGSGKTTWVDDWLVKVMRNNPNESLHCAYYSPENRPVGRAMAKIMEKYIKKSLSKDAIISMTDDEVQKAKYWLDQHFAFIYPDTKVKQNLFGKEMKNVNTLDSILTFARLSVEQYGSKVLVIDPWNKIEHEQGSMSETHYISKALDMCLEAGDRYNMSVVVIAHPAKVQDASVLGNFVRPSLYKISGSANWYNKADVGVVVHRDKYWLNEKNVPILNVDAPTQVYISKQKFQEVGEEGHFFQYMDRNQGDVFVCDKDDRKKIDYKKVSTKKRKQQALPEMDFEAEVDAYNTLLPEDVLGDEDSENLPF